MTIIGHFVHNLDEKQCANYTNISQKNNTTVIKWYKFCREVVTEWFWDPQNTPKLGGYGKIVEFDESFFQVNQSTIVVDVLVKMLGTMMTNGFLE